MLDIDATLARIGYHGPRAADAATLTALHRAFVMSVPFENLDIGIGRPIRLDTPALFDKIVRNKRGGFCYELNGLFASLLRELGFDVTLLSARVFADGAPGPEFDHLTLLVQLEQRWLADVGFCEFIDPLRLDDPHEQRQGNGVYRLVPGEPRWVYQTQARDGEWQNGYDFTLQPHQMEEFEAMCLHQQTSPASIFLKGRFCGLPTPTGRIALSDNRLIFTEAGERREHPIAAPGDFERALAEHFGIFIDG
jgi:N-hydroxyarylamine O-acetyltransferase